MIIVVGADHAGYQLKDAVKLYATALGHRVLDVGTNSADAVDYPDYAFAVGKAIMDASAERGILVCGSGVGACIAANKMPGVRAAICHDEYSAAQGVEHDDMNVLVLGGRVVGIEVARILVDAFLKARFTAEVRHTRRLDKVKAIEQQFMKPEYFAQAD